MKARTLVVLLATLAAVSVLATGAAIALYAWEGELAPRALAALAAVQVPVLLVALALGFAPVERPRKAPRALSRELIYRTRTGGVVRTVYETEDGPRVEYALAGGGETVPLSVVEGRLDRAPAKPEDGRLTTRAEVAIAWRAAPAGVRA